MPLYRVVTRWATVLILAFAVASCGKTKTAEDEHEHGEEAHAHEEGATAVTITDAQYKQLDIQLGTVEQKNLTATLRASGVLKVPPQNKANVTAAFGGTVQQILVQEGDYVKKGQALATLTNPQFVTMQQDFLDTQAQLTFAEADYNRQKELAEKNVTAEKTYQQATANYNSLRAKASGLRQQLGMLGVNASQLAHDNIASVASVRSPINGNVSHIDVNIGSTVEPSNPLMDVVDNSQLHLDLFVFEQDLPKVRNGQSVDITLTNLPGKHYTAKVFAVGSAFEGNSKSVPVHAAITGDKTGLIEGMNVTANIGTGTDAVAAVPNSAITSFAGNDYVFIQTEAQHAEGEPEHEHANEHADDHAHSVGEAAFAFERVQIKRGTTDGGYTEIIPLADLPEGAKIVVNGAFYLMAMLTNEGEEHEH